MVLKKGDRVVLNDEKLYVVLEQINLEGISYCCVALPSENAHKMLDSVLFVKEVVKDGKLFVSPITDKNIITKLTEIMSSRK